MPTSITPAPTRAQVAALVDYARKHGRRWKADLCSDWTAGRDVIDPLLRQLRNDFGPHWLLKFRLPDFSTFPAAEGGDRAQEQNHAM